MAHRLAEIRTIATETYDQQKQVVGPNVLAEFNPFPDVIERFCRVKKWARFWDKIQLCAKPV